MAIALSGSLILSGSITVSGSIISTGTISMSGSIASASYASNAELLDGLDSTVFTLTSSFIAQTASFTAFTSSINAFSASILAQTASLNSFSSSVLTFTGSAATRLGALEAATASLYTATGSQNTRLGALEAATASLYTATSSFNAFSASLNSYTSSTDAKIVSIYSTTSSLNTRVGTLEAYTSSLNAKTSSFATTGSNIFIGNQTITGSIVQSGSFTSTGTITAQMLVVQTITSSVLYSSGSNVFGNDIANTQTFTGSLSVTGSTAYFAGNVGVGTTSPSEKLHTIGNIKIEQTSNTNAVLTLNPNSGTLGTGYQWNLVGVNSGANYAFQIREASSPYLTITNSAGGTGGNVGIGTTNPTNKLVVQGGASFRGGTNFTQANYNDSGSTIDIVVDNQQPKIYSSYWSGTEKNLYLGTYSQQSLLVLTTGGNVGIGTTAPSSKLNVNGNIGFAGDTDKLFYMPDIYQGTGSIFMQAGFGSAAAGGALKLYGHNATTYTGGDVEVGLSSKGNFLINSYIGGTRLVTVKVDGTVGIGTTSPDERLTVGAGNGISIRTVNSGTYGALKFGTNNATYAADWAGIDSDWEGVGVNVSNLRFYTSYGAISEKMRIAANGNVGIGTTSPSQLLHLYKSSGTVFLSLQSSTNYGYFYNDGTNIGLASDAGTTGLKFIVNRTAPDSAVVINSDGNVGIGTTSPAYKLHVNGNIFSSGLVIENTTNGISQTQITNNSVNSQGTGKWRTYSRTILATGTGTKLNIPFVNQGSLNIVTLARVIVSSADYNSAYGGSAQFMFSVGSLTALSNLSILSSGGSYSSATTSGMNVVVTLGSFSAAYVVIEYLTPEPAYSIDLANITLTS